VQRRHSRPTCRAPVGARADAAARLAAVDPAALDAIEFQRSADFGGSSARIDAISGNGSGDIFIAFSKANANAAGARDVASVRMRANDRISAVFAATVRGLRSCRMRA
jgi:L-aminopeptidase/D-esterase-like protein